MKHTVYAEQLEYRKYRGGGWCVIGVPPTYDGVDDSVLIPYLINDNLLFLIGNTEQPEHFNVTIIKEAAAAPSYDSDSE